MNADAGTWIADLAAPKVCLFQQRTSVEARRPRHSRDLNPWALGGAPQDVEPPGHNP